MSIQDEQAKQQSSSAKIVYEFVTPRSLVESSSNGSTLPSKIGLRQLTAEQELLASKAGKYDIMRQQYAAVKLAIIEFDGRRVDHSDGSIDKFWDGSPPKMRSLLLSAYNKISSPSSEEEESFLKSEAVKV